MQRLFHRLSLLIICAQVVVGTHAFARDPKQTWADHTCAISTLERNRRIETAVNAFEVTLGKLTHARELLSIETENLRLWNHTSRTQSLLSITGTLSGIASFSVPLVLGAASATWLEIGFNAVSGFVWMSSRFYAVFEGGDLSQASEPDFLIQKEIAELLKTNLSLDEAHDFLSSATCEQCSIDSSRIEKALTDLNDWATYKEAKFGSEPNLWLNPFNSYYREKAAQVGYPRAVSYVTLLTLKKIYQHSLIRVLRHDEAICSAKK